MFSWNVGPKIKIDYDNIVEERAIICICYKWADESKVHYLTWNKGNDKKMLEEFVKVMNEADEVIGHNSDNFDIKWLRTQCLIHSIPMMPDYQSVDTYKLAKKYFRLNSNRLDYIGKRLEAGKKVKTDFGLWKSVVLENDVKALRKMVAYCQQDVNLLEKVFDKFNPYVGHKTHVGVILGKSNHSCPECGDTHCISNGQRITATGRYKQRMHCQKCGKYFSINITK